MIKLLDTNIILRYLVRDNENQYNEAVGYFKKAEQGKLKLLIKPTVIAEASFVLETYYKKTNEEIASSMEVFLSQKWLKVEDRKALLLMWQWYRQNLHFVDSYLLACAKIEGIKVLTFDEQIFKLEADN